MPTDETVGQPPSGSANSNDPTTQPAPTVVTSQPAENAIGDAQNNINQYNTNAANVTPPATPPPTSTPTATPTPSGSNTPNVNYGSYTDPKTGETSYYAQTGTDSQGNPTYASDPTDPSIALNSGVGAVQIPTPGASGNSVSSPLTPGANVDGNGNIVGTNVPAAVALGSSEDVTSINARLSALNDTITQSGQDSVNMLNGLMNGTIPLSPAQTSVIQNMTTQMNNLIALQTTANNSYVGSITEEQARNGDQSSAPANAMSMVHMAVSNANIQLSSIAAAQGLAISQATDAFQQQDFSQMLAANAQYQDTLKQSQAVLEQLATTIQSSIESARTYNLNVINTQFANNMSSATLSLQQKQDLLTNYLATQNLTIAQKAQATNQFNAESARITALNGRYTTVTNPITGLMEVFDNQSGQFLGAPSGSIVNGEYSGSAVNTTTGQPVQPGATGNPLLDANTKKTMSGVSYIDTTDMTGAQVTAAEAEGAQYGIPVLTAAQASAVNNLTTAQENINNIANVLTSGNNPILAKSGWDVTTKLGNLLQASTQIGPNADVLGSFGTWRTAAIGVLKGLAGGASSGLRINQAEIALSVQNDIPNITDTVGVAQGKITKLDSMIDNQLNGIFGSNYPKMKAEGSSNPLQSYSALSPQNAQAVAAAVQQYPNATPAQILQIVP